MCVCVGMASDLVKMKVVENLNKELDEGTYTMVCAHLLPVCLSRNLFFDVTLCVYRTTCPSQARTLTPDPPASCSTSSTRYVCTYMCVCTYVSLLMNVFVLGQVTSLGFVQETFDAWVNGITQSVLMAYKSQQPAKILGKHLRTHIAPSSYFSMCVSMCVCVCVSSVYKLQ
jgi:hypothetical protein